MAHKIVGLFKNRSDAQAAMQELTGQGFDSEHIDISSFKANEPESIKEETGEPPRTSDGPVPGTMSTLEVSPTPNFAQSIADFFSSIFGGDETRVNSYSEAARNAEAILTVELGADENAETAHAIMDRNGAINVEESDTNTQTAIS